MVEALMNTAIAIALGSLPLLMLIGGTLSLVRLNREHPDKHVSIGD
jgi:hypothetical protein